MILLNSIFVVVSALYNNMLPDSHSDNVEGVTKNWAILPDLGLGWLSNPCRIFLKFIMNYFSSVFLTLNCEPPSHLKPNGL